MCGIAGFLSTLQRSPDERTALLHGMLRGIALRGPDASGCWIPADQSITFGHQRLSILDLSPAGAQPMHSRTTRYTITFNGEIYNYRELRGELEQRGATWRGSSDTEVMLEAFEQFGVEAAVKKMVGMFAFAVWDAQQHSLTLCRDRLGEKPLYYGWYQGLFVFASELKAVRSGFQKKPAISPAAVGAFLRFNCIPAPHSIYSEFFKLPAGTLLTIPQDEGSQRPAQFSPFAALNNTTGLAPKRFWDAEEIFRAGAATPLQCSDQEASELLEQVLSRSVQQQMISDVPLGAFLSGGIDSSLVVALMQRHNSSPVRTFSIGFHEQEFNEANHAKVVAHALGTAHTELYVSPTEAQAVIPQLASIYDEPFADSSQIPTFLVSKLARQHVTVSLSGDGGDELFGGYSRYRIAERLWRGVGWLPSTAQNGLRALITSISAERWEQLLRPFAVTLPASMRRHHLGEKLHKVAAVLGAARDQELYLRLMSHWELAGLSIPPNTLSGAVTEHERSFGELPFAIRMMLLDLVTYLPDDILVKVDRAAMAVSLESRAPFLDHRVVEFAARLPLHQKIRGRETKFLLRQLLARHLPKKLWDRPKMGFGVPIGSWLKGPLRDWAEDLLSEQSLKDSGLLSAHPVRQRWQRHLAGQGNWQYQLWDVLMLQSWLRENG